MRADRPEGIGRTGPRDAWVVRRPRVLVLVAAWCLAGWGAVALGDEPLRWKFKPGETLRFSVESNTSLELKGASGNRKSRRTQTLEITWKVIAVDASGGAEINHRADRLRMRAEEPPYMPFDFDSATSKEPQAGFEDLVKMLQAQVGAEFTFKMKPNGEIIDIRVPEPTLKRFRDAAPAGGQAPEISEKALKDELIQNSPPTFPDDPVGPGKSWTAKPARVPLPFPFVLVLDRTYSYQGPDPKAPNLVVIGIETNAKLEPVGGTDAKAQLRKQDGKGSMTVDLQAGRMVSTKQSTKLEMTISGPTGQSLEHTSESSSSMTLLP
jgi:Family of unknown function (DUF6263)